MGCVKQLKIDALLHPGTLNWFLLNGGWLFFGSGVVIADVLSHCQRWEESTRLNGERLFNGIGLEWFWYCYNDMEGGCEVLE